MFRAIHYYLRRAYFALLNGPRAVLWLLLMFKAYQGERFKLPLAGDIAEQRA